MEPIQRNPFNKGTLKREPRNRLNLSHSKVNLISVCNGHRTVKALVLSVLNEKEESLQKNDHDKLKNIRKSP